MNRRILSFAAGIAISALPAQAHHSIAGYYDTNQEKAIEGIVKQFQFINPHPFVTIETKNADGSTQLWRLELDNRRELIEVGMTAETLKQGDRVVVSGSPGKEQAQSLYIRRLDRPSDGFRYEQIGSSPRVRFPSR
jgi:Family of unknown function (DUF6152)